MFEEKNISLIRSRHRIYREHKYIFYIFSELLQFVASLDFSEEHLLGELNSKVEELKGLLQSHAEHEESRIHSILKNKNIYVFIIVYIYYLFNN